MTGNRVKAAARRLQAGEGIPYAEALRRVLADGPAAPAAHPVRRPDPGPGHRCFDWLVLGSDPNRDHFCRQCAAPELIDRVDAVDQAARDLRIIGRIPGETRPWHGLDWPYGPNIDLESREALVEWAAPLDLRQSTTHNKCLHWLRGKQCPRDTGYGTCGATVPGADHVSMWNRGPGRNPAVIVSQPYGLTDQARVALAALDDELDLGVEIDEDGGWYGANTTWVAIWRTD